MTTYFKDTIYLPCDLICHPPEREHPQTALYPGGLLAAGWIRDVQAGGKGGGRGEGEGDLLGRAGIDTRTSAIDRY